MYVLFSGYSFLILLFMIILLHERARAHGRPTFLAAADNTPDAIDAALGKSDKLKVTRRDSVGWDVERFDRLRLSIAGLVWDYWPSPWGRAHYPGL